MVEPDPKKRPPNINVLIEQVDGLCKFEKREEVIELPIKFPKRAKELGILENIIKNMKGPHMPDLPIVVKISGDASKERTELFNQIKNISLLAEIQFLGATINKDEPASSLLSIF